MNKYIIIDDEDKFSTKYEYEVGDEIIINSTMPVKCVKTEIINNELLQYFVSSIRIFNDEFEKILEEKAELLQALKSLWSIRSEPWTDEQRQHKFRVECEVEEILKKYI